MPITIKNATEIERMGDAGHIVALVHARLADAIQPGITTAELDELARRALAEYDAVSSFLGYNGFPGHICTSVNDEIVHGIPGRRILRDGDIISVDVGAKYRGFHGDSAWTYPVGTVTPATAALLTVTEESLGWAIAAALPGARLGAVSHAVERFGRAHGCGVVQGYGGHGIGREMHEDPHVPNHGDPARGVRLRPGMTLAIEPMLTAGSPTTKVLADRWTVVTADGSLSAHFEHTVAVTDGEALVLTKRLVPVVH